MAQKTTETSSEMEELQKAISNKKGKEFINIFDNYKDKKNLKSDVRNYRCHSKKEGENTENNNTILHHAAVNLDDEDDDNDIIEKIVKLSPDLLACGKVSETHKGQTPIHILIVRKQKETLRRIKDLILSDKLEMGDTVRNNISNPKVEGKLFEKTIMEGELPHIVAALTLDIEIAKIVIEMTSQNIKAKNSNGNTVYHCLVQHAARNPNDIQEVIAMWKFLVRYPNEMADLEKADLIVKALDKKTMRETNNDHLRPLQLAAKLGVADLFDIILNLEKIKNDDEGLFDSDLYDICVIDTVTHFKVQTVNKKNHENNENAKRNQVGPIEAGNKEDKVGKAVTTEKYKWSQSVLEMVCNRKVARNKDSVYQIIRQPAVKMLIKLKWKESRKAVRILALIHFCLMVWYSAYAVVWSVEAFPSNSTNPAITDYQRTFMFVSSILCFVVGAL
ncbi:uncharacterized protein LOC110461787 [Mizuhopecten yessoensis]|uniref:uncharacterized protein LOC110461787 n=1 Tax=Mizuhopecten yessoensis TaxID=6573 RepID=UPI000B45DBBC|nr:uncharacterized protein LOC110461787 [Mizuhopecten yessoensis]XP_021371128.1 uncharacterized protein LOC110461787 [Mizuhopecten yessoensis]